MYRSRLISAVPGLGLATLVIACAEPSVSPTAPSSVDAGRPVATAGADGGGGVTTSDAPASAASVATFEVKFMIGMIDHHMMAVTTAGLCLERAVHAELRALCSTSQTTQMQEIELMQGWLQSWYGIAYEPTAKPGAQHRMERLAALSGTDFEIAFMEMMIRHHAAAVREGGHCRERAQHPELLELCRNIVITQTAEIEQMPAWLCQWYGECQPTQEGLASARRTVVAQGHHGSRSP